MPIRATTKHAIAFEVYLQNWRIHQQTLLHELLSAQKTLNNYHEIEINMIITRVLAHYQDYFEEKSRMVNRNAFQMLSPSWLTPFEKAFLWLGGFKPGMAFTIAFTCVKDLTEEQKEKLEELKTEINNGERKLVNLFAKIQETVGAPPLMDQAREEGARGPRFNGEDREVDGILETLKIAMEDVLIKADKLRTQAAEMVVEILTPVQSLRFFSGAAEFQMKIRSMGIQKEAEKIQQEAALGTVLATHEW